MTKYTVTEKSFVNNSIQEVGAVVDYDGPVSSNLSPVDGAVAPTSSAAEDLARQKLAAAGINSTQLDQAAAEAAAAAQKVADTVAAANAAQIAAVADAAAKAALASQGDASQLV